MKNLQALVMILCSSDNEIEIGAEIGSKFCSLKGVQKILSSPLVSLSEVNRKKARVRIPHMAL